MSGLGIGSGQVDAQRILAEARKAFFVMLGLLALIWAVQVVNWANDYALSRHHGIGPGEVSTLPGVFTATFLHWSWQHIEANSGPLFVFGFLAAYRGVARFLGLSVLVMAGCGLAAWVFGDHGTRAVGASGLVYGYFAYVVLRGLFDRHLIDSLIGVVMAGSYAYLLTAAVPGAPGVGWLGHLGGLVGGAVGAWVFRDRGRRAAPEGGLPARTRDNPRAALHKELDELGLL
ncbi:rhomboid family intramembrane serine protease [Streptomyces abikoensis]